jgi:SPP1 gp7 family putative phage head morphogenesis protein
MAKKNPFIDVTNDFLRKWDKLSPKLQKEILSQIDKGKTANEAVKYVFTKNDLKGKLREWLSDVQFTSVTIGFGDAIGIEHPLAMRKYFLNETFQGDSLSLSQRVTRLDLQKDVVSTLQANLSAAKTVHETAKELKEYTTQEDLRKGIRELESAARSVIHSDTPDFKSFQKILDRETTIAEAAMLDGDETVLQRAYMRVVKAAASLNEVALNKAIENAIDQKARSNAFRIAHTEASRAYGMAVRTRAINDDLCTGIEWALSSGEGHCDICEELDGSIFAKDELPEYPAHPHCSCNLIPRYDNVEIDDSADWVTDDNTIPENFIDLSGLTED